MLNRVAKSGIKYTYALMNNVCLQERYARQPEPTVQYVLNKLTMEKGLVQLKHPCNLAMNSSSLAARSGSVSFNTVYASFIYIII